MRLLLLSIVLVAAGSTLTSAQDSDPNYLITAPNRFIPGRPETVCIELFDTVDTTQIEFVLTEVWVQYSWRKLPEGTTNSTLATAVISVTAEEESKCFTMTVPKVERDSHPDYLLLSASGTVAGSDRKFKDEMKIELLSKWIETDVTFIQTDKPVYKPGQLVQFRVLTLDTQLKPTADEIELMHIKTPDNVRVEQWNDINMDQGMKQFKFQLADEPAMGFYTITVKRNGKKYSEQFEVKEYVLPKYEVTITPQKYITFQSERVTADVCAKYTFGLPVQGNLEGSVCIKEQKFRPWFFERAGPPGQEKDSDSVKDGTYCTSIDEPLVDGCYKIDVSKTDVGWDRYTTYQYGVSLEIDAKVREKGSGTYINGTKKTLSFQRYDINVEMEGPDRYKPGLPYNALVTVKKLDGTPAPGELISIEINNWGPYNSYSKNYTTDTAGLIKFSLPPVVDDIPSYSIRARAVNYATEFWSYSAPQGYLYVQGWYSPTGSFLQMQPKNEKLACGSTATFKVQYTTSIALDTEIKYKVTGMGDIIAQGSTAVSLNLNTAIDETDSEDEWDTTPRDGCFYYWWRCPIAVAAEDTKVKVESSTEDSGEEVQKKVLESTTSERIAEGPSTETAIIEESETVDQVAATHKGTFMLEIPITPEMSKTALVVVYYVRPDGEVVADGIELQVETCSKNDAEISFSKQRAKPGEEVDIQLKASAGSLCSYGIVDKSVFLEGGDNQLTLDKALDRIQQFNLREWSGAYESTSERCDEERPGELDNTKRSSYAYWDVPYQDAGSGFKKGGLAYMSNLRVKTSPCLKKYQQIFFAARTKSFDGAPGAPGASNSKRVGADSEESGPQNGAPDEVSKTVRTYFPETWLWDMVTIDSDGKTNVPTTVPDTITEWIGNAVCLSKTDGLGVSEPASLIAFQPFFVSMNLPYSVKRQERLPVSVTVSNYQSRCMAVQISMNSLSGYSVRGKPSVVKCVCGQDTVTQKFTIVTNDIGDVNVSISAEIVDQPSACPANSKMTKLIGTSDTVIRPVIVEPEGSPRDYTVSDFVCMTLPGSDGSDVSVSEDYSLPLPPKGELVDGSERAYVTVVGDVMGPALSNIANLLRMPYGCAEQTMVSFAPNIFVMKYLEAVNKDDPAVSEKAKRFMKSGYMRELTYAHNDQSYSSFGTSQPEKPGSMWLTAFVVKCFGLARPYIFIDKTIQQKSVRFFTKKQNSDGCFPQIGKVHNKYMQGGFGQDSTNKAALTAFVTIAMMEAGFREEQAESLDRAFECIADQRYDDAYTTAIVTYAYSLYQPESNKAKKSYSKLMGMAKRKDGLKFWKADETEPEEPKSSWWWYRPHSADTETTAYALMAMLNMKTTGDEKISQGLPIVRWLSTQRNPYGGFGSTQDTVIGLQALSEFAELIYTDGVQASIRIKDEGGKNVARFEVSEENSFVEFTQKLPKVKDIALTARGKGCFLVQTNVRYNIDKTDEKRQAFDTSVKVSRRRGSKDPCTMKTMKICTKYTGEGGVSNMAIISVKMVSGWKVDETSLKELVKNEEVARYEVDPDGTAELYFEELDPNKKCFTFDIDQEFVVKNTKPAVVTTYDYYKTELRQEIDYRIWLCRKEAVKNLPAIRG